MTSLQLKENATMEFKLLQLLMNYCKMRILGFNTL